MTTNSSKAKKWTWEDITCPDAFMCEDGKYVSAETVGFRVGYRVPVILTIAAWKEFVAWTQDATDSYKQQCESTRLWDVIWMCRWMADCTGHTVNKYMPFELYSQPDGGREDFVLKRLKAICESKEFGFPALKIMLPNET